MAYDAFLKIDGIDGESTDKLHEKWIELLSFSWGASNPSVAVEASSGKSVGKTHFQDFSFTAQTNAASPKLFQACAQGSHFQKVVLSCRKVNADGAPQDDFIKITFQTILISSYVEGGHVTDDLPLDQVSFNFQKADIQLLASTPTGSPGTVTSALGA